MKKKRKKRLFYFIIMAFFGIVLVRQQMVIIRLNTEYKSHQQTLNKLKLENQQLSEEVKISKRADYIERLARQKLRLIKPGEILFIDKNKKNNWLTIYFFLDIIENMKKFKEEVFRYDPTSWKHFRGQSSKHY